MALPDLMDHLIHSLSFCRLLDDSFPIFILKLEGSVDLNEMSNLKLLKIRNQMYLAYISLQLLFSWFKWENVEKEIITTKNLWLNK